jgi:hypothetical protein
MMTLTGTITVNGQDCRLEIFLLRVNKLPASSLHEYVKYSATETAKLILLVQKNLYITNICCLYDEKSVNGSQMEV